MKLEHWKTEEVDDLLTYMNEAEQRTMQMLVHFAQTARAHPDSTWGPVSAFGMDQDEEDKPVSEDMMTSAEFVADLDMQMGALLRAAVVRKSVRN